jgi:hypothetical protein
VGEVTEKVDGQQFTRGFENANMTDPVTISPVFKDIVQPKKRGVKRGTIPYVLTSIHHRRYFLDIRKGLISRRK